MSEGTEAVRAASAQAELGSLALSCVQADNPMFALRAAQIRNALHRVKLDVPFFVVHDLVLLFVAEPALVLVRPRAFARQLPLDATERASLEAYEKLLGDIAVSEVLDRARAWKLPDDLLAVVLVKVLSPIHESFQAKVGAYTGPALLPLDPRAYQELDRELPRLFAEHTPPAARQMLEILASRALRLVTAIEQIDLDTLRLLGIFGAEAGAASALQMLDLLQVLESPEANDVVSFSLDLLPSVLETKRAGGAQTYAVDGYSGVSRRGTLDSLVLTELAFGPEVFARRFVEQDVFYYARSKEHDEARRLHYVAVDASASMRGRRAVFARGLALTLTKKLLLRGEDVDLRFFDARLYEAQHARPGRGESGGLNVPYVLSFRGEHGRNYPKVFALLAHELERLKKRDGREIVVYLLTHAQCHIPDATVERLARVAKLYGVFMLPSTGELELGYLDRLTTVQVVDEGALGHGKARAKRALDIVEDAAARGREAPRR
jgi:hypothetical protein